MIDHLKYVDLANFLKNGWKCNFREFLAYVFKLFLCESAPQGLSFGFTSLRKISHAQLTSFYSSMKFHAPKPTHLRGKKLFLKISSLKQPKFMYIIVWVTQRGTRNVSKTMVSDAHGCQLTPESSGVQVPSLMSSLGILVAVR